MRYVIAGAGPAGVTAAETLRALEPGASIALVNGEATPPYARMALPYVIGGAIEPSGAHLRQRPGFFDELHIELVADRVVATSLGDGRLKLASGATLGFDRLLVATGVRPKAPTYPGLDVEGVDTCWTMEDARRITARCTRGARVVLIGAGFVACIILKALLARGARVTVVTGSSGQLVRTMLCRRASELLTRWCVAEKDVAIVRGEGIAGIDRGPVVALKSGKHLEADAVVIATGVEPNLELLEGTGIATEEGVVVDDHFLCPSTARGARVYAAGDVAQGPSFGAKARRVHPIHPIAVEHGRMAALNMAGRETAYHGGLQMNVLDTAGLASFSFGRWSDTEQDLVDAEDAARYRFIRLCFEGDRLVGANGVGFDREVGALRGLIQTRAALGGWKAKLRDNPFRFAEAFVARLHS